MATQAQEKISEVIPKLIKVDIVCNKKVLFPVELNPNETLMELRQILSETSQLFFYISYAFYFEGKKLDEFSEVLNQANLTNGSQLEIQFQQYDERSCKYHIKKVQEFVNNPQNYGHILSSPLKWSVDNLPDMKEKLEKIEESQTKKEFDAKNLLSINDALETKLSLYSNISSNRKDRGEKVNLLISLGQSAFNPPSAYRKMRGDLVYLHLKTLEGLEYHISGCYKGFYFNKSSNRVFDPTPANNLLSYSILDLISSVSPLFNQKIKEIIDNENILPNLAQNLANPLSLYSYGRSWLVPEDEKASQNHEPNWLRAEMAFTNLYGFEPSSVREWNDEFQASLELPKDDLFQRLNRDKALIKSHSDFVEAAVQGAKAIIEKNLLPLNPMDPQNQQVFVYNHIFFSFVTPCPDSFKQETGPDACPTVPMSNCDLRNLKVLLRLKLSELSLVHTCIIDYKGWTVVAQSIIPGILSVDHSLCTEFGTLDDGKTINSSPEFEAIIKKVCEYFSLEEDIPFLDEAGKEHKISGSVEVKGIKGTDRRRYLLDLLRLSPRDVNWVSEGDEYLCCVLRPEIISHYVTSKNLIAAREKVLEEREKEQKESEQQQQAAAENEENKGEGEITEKKEGEKKPASSFTYADFITKLQQQLSRPDKEKIRLNSNLYTKIKLGEIPNIEDQKKRLEEVADFITKQAIPNLIKELLHGEVSLPVDSQTLGELLHGHGINVRYIGKIAQTVSKSESPFLLILLERIIFAKCLKHYTKEQMRSTNHEDFPELIARILNCTFGSEKCLEVLEEGLQFKQEGEASNQPQEETKEAAAETVSKKKKKKNKEEKPEDLKVEEHETHDANKSAKKKKKKKAGITKPAENASTVSDIFIQIDNVGAGQEQEKPYNAIKPSDIWKRLVEIAKKRYQYDLPESFKEFVPFKYPLTKLATLRDFCLSTGIKLATKHYQLHHNGKHHFSEQKSQGGQKPSFLAFSAEDVMDISPIIKHLDPISEDARVNLEIAYKLVAEREFEDAIDSLVASIQIFMNLYGPIHKDIAICYSRLGSLFFKLEDYQQALIHHKQALIVLEKFYGTDHPQTGHAYLNLGLFYFSVKEYERGFSYMLKSLYCFNLVGGECHPEASNVLVSLASKYQEQKKHQAAISCLLEALDRSTIIFGEKSPRVAHIYQQLAVTHFEIKDIKKATEFQENAIRILKENYPANDPKVTDAVLNLQKIQNSGKEKLMEESKKQASEPKKRAFGQNKPLQPANGQRENTNEMFNADQSDIRNDSHFERESALQRLRFAKLQAKQGMRGQNQVDLLRYMQYMQARSGYLGETGQNPSKQE